MRFVLFATALLATGVASADIENNWYIGAFGGYTSLSSNIKTRYYGYLLSDVHYFPGYNFGGSIGYKCNPLRYEFQYTYLFAGTDRYNVDNDPHLRIDGGTKVNMLMANLYYDFPTVLEEITPFVGIGAGYAFMRATLNSTSRFDRPHFNASQNAFAYQGTAGLSYNFTEQLAINAAYRYAATATSGNWGKTLQAQMGNAELVYRF